MLAWELVGFIGLDRTEHVSIKFKLFESMHHNMSMARLSDPKGHLAVCYN